MSAVGDFFQNALDTITGTTRYDSSKNKPEPKVQVAPTNMDYVPEKYQPLIKKYASQYGVPEDILARVGRAESHYNPNAIGKKDPNDLGLMQANLGKNPDVKKEIPNFKWNNPDNSIQAAAYILAKNRKSEFITNDEQLGLSYNLGAKGVGNYSSSTDNDTMQRGNTYTNLLYPERNQTLIPKLQ